MKKLLLSVLLLLVSSLGFAQTVQFGDWKGELLGNIRDGYVKIIAIEATVEDSAISIMAQSVTGEMVLAIVFNTSSNFAAQLEEQTAKVIWITDEMEEPAIHTAGFLSNNGEGVFTLLPEIIESVIDAISTATEIVFRTSYDGEEFVVSATLNPEDTQAAMEWLFSGPPKK